METTEKIIENPYGFIYITTNMVNGRRYLGKKKIDDDDDWKTYLGSGTILRRAIEKYKPEKFSRNIVCFCNSSEELNETEYELSVFLNVVESKNWYNLQYGGAGGSEGRIVSDETRRKISEASRGRQHTEEFKIKMKERFTGENNPMFGKCKTPEQVEHMREVMSGENNPNYGKPRSDETKAKISNSLKGRYIGENNPNYGKHLSEEAKRRISQANTGRIPNEETRRKMSEARRGMIQSPETIQKRSGENHYLYGKCLTEEVKNKISNSRKGKCAGKDNPNYGNGIPVVQLTLSGELVARYITIREASRVTGINYTTIKNCCKNRCKSAEGFIWIYADLYDDAKQYVYTNNNYATVVQLDKNGVLLCEYKSISEASQETGVPTSSICQCCKNKQKTAKGFKWMYKEDYENNLKI